MSESNLIQWRQRTIPDALWDVRFGVVMSPETAQRPLYAVYGEPWDDFHDLGLFWPGYIYGTYPTESEAMEAKSTFEANPRIHWQENTPDRLYVDLARPITNLKIPWLYASVRLRGHNPPRIQKGALEKDDDWPTDEVAIAFSVSFKGTSDWLRGRIKSQDDWEWVIRMEGPDLPFMYEEWDRCVSSCLSKYGLKDPGDLTLD